ncbi:hypothetical protein Peur_072486 [Populus x canadensis]
MADYYVLSQLKDDVSWVVYRGRTFIACTLSAEKIRRLADFLGTEEYAFEFIKKGGGKTTEANYPYRAHDGACDVKKGTSQQYLLIDMRMRLIITRYITQSCCPPTWCITGDYGKELGHGAAIVGYGTTKDGTKVILGHLNGEKKGYN